VNVCGPVVAIDDSGRARPAEFVQIIASLAGTPHARSAHQSRLGEAEMRTAMHGIRDARPRRCRRLEAALFAFGASCLDDRWREQHAERIEHAGREGGWSREWEPEL
jgi:hypothetical protein